MHTKSSHEMKLSTKYPEWTSYASPLILEYVLNASSSVLNFPPKWILDWYFKLHSYEIEWQNETECQTHRMDFTCALAIFCIDFESIRLSVKLSTKVGFSGSCKLHTDKVETRNETECQTP